MHCLLIYLFAYLLLFVCVYACGEQRLITGVSHLIF